MSGQNLRPNSTLVFKSEKILLERRFGDRCYDYLKFVGGQSHLAFFPAIEERV